MARLKRIFSICLCSLSLFTLIGCSFSSRSFPSDSSEGEAQIVSYDITSNPNKTQYVVGEQFDPTGLSVTINWDNGNKEIIKGEDIVFPTKSFKIKDQEIKGVYKEKEIVVPITVIAINGYSINIGSTSMGLKNFNTKYDNQKSYVTYLNNKKTLVMELNGDTSIDDAEGVFDFINYEDVLIKGNGVLSLSVNGESDGINANNMTINEGVTINLNGTGHESGIKVLENFNIKGTLNISNFVYAQAIAKREDSIAATPIYTRVFSTGKYNINNCTNGPYAWSSVEYSPTLHVSGEFNVSATTSCIRFCDKINGKIIFDENSKINLVSSEGRSIWNTSGSVYIRDNSNVILNSKIAAVTGVDYFIVGNGNNGSKQNNASLKIESDGGNFIETYNGNSERNNVVVFNSKGELYFKSNADKAYNAINFLNRADNESSLYIACQNMVIENAKFFINTTRSLNAAIKVTYNYSDNAKVNLKNCLGPLDSSNEILNTIFSSIFNNDTINIING